MKNLTTLIISSILLALVGISLVYAGASNNIVSYDSSLQRYQSKPLTGDAYIGTVVLQSTTGDEVAVNYEYTTNKAAGNDTGLRVNQIDTASPGTSLLLDLSVGGTKKVVVNNLGYLGVGGSSNPIASLDVGGSIATATRTVASADTLDAADHTIWCDATSDEVPLGLPTAVGIDGREYRVKKIDGSTNDCVIDGNGSETIDGELTRVIHIENAACTIKSNNVNWRVIQCTPTAVYGEMHLHDNATVTTVNTVDIPHLVQGLFVEQIADGFTFNAGSTGPISAFADYSGTVAGTVKATDVAHGLATGAILSQSGTTNYNGIFTITVIDVDNYYFTDAWVADDATGNWYEGDNLVVDVGSGGIYFLNLHGFGSSAGANKTFEFELYKNATPQENVEAQVRFSSGDIQTIGGGGIVTLADGDIITLGIIGLTDATDFTLAHTNVSMFLLQ